MQKEGYNGLTGLERGKHCKRPEENDKKLRMSLVQIGEREREREREKFEKLLKSEFEQVKLSF